MTINRSSCDLSMLQSITSQIRKTRSEIQQTQDNTTSDLKKQHYYEMDAPLADQNIQVEVLLKQNDLKIKNYDWATNLLYLQESAINKLNDIALDAKKFSVRIMNEQGSSIVKVDMDSKNMLNEIQDTMLTSFFGMNIWNGSHTNELPFSDIVNGQSSDNYYLGDDFNLKFYIDGYGCEFGDRADYECFRQLINGLQTMRDSQDENGFIDKEKVAEASTMIDAAQDGLCALLQKVGNVEQAVNSAKEEALDCISTLSELYITSLNGMSEEDRALSVMNASAVQRKLSYMLPIAMKYLNEMSIVKYL